MPTQSTLPAHANYDAGGRCHADPRCPSTPCFRIELHDPSGGIAEGATADACADHLGVAVQDLVGWARRCQFGDGHLYVCVIDASQHPQLTTFPFARVPVARPGVPTGAR